MQQLIFTEEFCRPELLYPFSLVRQVQDLRIGIRTIREKWEQALQLPSVDRQLGNYKDSPSAIPLHASRISGVCYLIHANLLPTPALVEQVTRLKAGECLLAGKGPEPVVFAFGPSQVQANGNIRIKKSIPFTGHCQLLHQPWEIFQWNQQAIPDDFTAICAGRTSQPVSATNAILGNPSLVFLEKGVHMEHVLLNTQQGPIYIGKNALVMEGSSLRGPVAVLEGAVVKMGTRIYGATSIGKSATAGGEIKNSVLFDYANKAHDGYLGDSVIGEYCNLGAGTSNSNLKNNASPVRIWTPEGQQEVGLKCGLLMGDYSRAAINTSFNTGTVVGISCNVVANGLTPTYIPSFSWGADGIERYRLDKALRDIRSWKKLKNKKLSSREKTILTYIFEQH